MRRTLLRLAPILHLTRVTTAFAAVGNVWFVILWSWRTPQEPGTRAMAETPLWLLLLGGAVNALGLFAYAATLNDLLDVKRDRAIHPERPLPSGRLSAHVAVSLVVCTLMSAVLGATLLGTQAILLTLLLSGAILFFNGAGRFVPAVGLVVLGLIYSGQMVVPNLNLRFVWPVWLVMTHSLIVAGLVHMVARKVPAISRRAVAAAAAGWLFWSAVMLYAGWLRCRNSGGVWPEWVPVRAALGPAVLSLLFAVMAYRKVRTYGSNPRAAEKITRYGTLWLSLYGVAWLLGTGHVTDALILGSLAAAGFLGMTVLRELYSMLEHPMGYRR
ncbi:MAG: UbiA family prenyltransferase [Phycisphaeraceae bacterium]|nr:UbiA family prenyltransferase [Phycisphaeraceae bacterium]